MKDYYKILGVDKDATADEIKSAYRKLAMKWHPDRNPDDPTAKDRFAEINEAYETLSDPQKKEQYDNPSPFGDMGGEGGPGRAWRDPDGGVHFEWHGGMPGGMGGMPGFGGIDDFMRAYAGMGGMRGFRRNFDPNAPRPGEDMLFGLQVGFMEAIEGCSKTVKLNITEDCGCESGCAKCDGTRRVKKTVKLEVKIPKGCPDGQRLRVAGQGNKGYNGGPPGDIYFEIEIGTHEVFVRDGFDLLEKVDVPFETFILGGKVKYKTLDGESEHEIAPFTKPGKVLVFKGKGVPVMNSINSNGDLKVLLDLKMPTDLNDEERKHLEAYRDSRVRNGK